MSLSENGGMQYTMGVAPAGAGGFGGWGGDSSWVVILILLCLFGGGWGGGFGGGMWPMMMMGGGFGGGWGMGYDFPWILTGQQQISNNTNNGFRDQMLNDNITSIRDGVYNINTQLCNGFANVNSNICQTGNAITNALRDGFYGAETAANARQMANMQQLFGLQTQAADCCCKTQTGIADLRYTVGTEACATRTADAQNTQAVLNAINGGIQSIKDQLCQDKIDAKDDIIAQLRQENLYARGQASQIAQNDRITDMVYNRLATSPVNTIPVFGNQQIWSCTQNVGNNGCGCGNNGLNF